MTDFQVGDLIQFNRSPYRPASGLPFMVYAPDTPEIITGRIESVNPELQEATVRINKDGYCVYVHLSQATKLT